MEIETVLWLVPVIGLASFVQGVVGFAFGMIAMGLGTILLDAQTASILVAPLATMNIALVLWSVRRDVSLRNAGTMVLGLIVGLPIGLAVLLLGDMNVLRLLVAALLLYTGIQKLVNGEGNGRVISHWWGVGAGVLGGILGGAANISGPPLIAYSAHQRWSPSVFKASLLTTFLIGSSLKTSALIVQGSLRGPLILTALALCPVVCLGSFLGVRLYGRFDRGTFGRIVAIMIIILGVWIAVGPYVNALVQESAA